MMFPNESLLSKPASISKIKPTRTRSSQAGDRFSACGDTCIFDFENPDAIEFVYDADQKCYQEKRDLTG